MREPGIAGQLTDEEAERLAAEYRAWRADAGLLPPSLVELRFRRWQRYLARQCGGASEAMPWRPKCCLMVEHGEAHRRKCQGLGQRPVGRPEAGSRELMMPPTTPRSTFATPPLVCSACSDVNSSACGSRSSSFTCRFGRSLLMGV